MSQQQYDFVQNLPVVLLVVVGGVATVGGALFGGVALAANTVLASITPAVRSLSKVLPGTVGITIGRQPTGVADQVADGLRPLLGRWVLIATGVAGGVAIWALTTTGTIGRWSFTFAMLVWCTSVIGVLPDLVDHRDWRAAVAAVWLAAGMGVAAFVDWGEVVATTGWRLIVVLGLATVVGVVARRLVDRAPRPAVESPDSIGIDRPFTPVEVEAAERRLGVVL